MSGVPAPDPNTPVRRLIVNADDFGFTHDVNEGIVDSHRNGILTATTLMANGDAFEQAVLLAQENPGLDVGCHLVLIGGNSCLPHKRPLPQSAADLVAAIGLRKLQVYDELRAQVEKILAAGIRPAHLDTHKHTHLLPPVLNAVARLSQEFQIPWVRRPFDIPLFALSRGATRATRITSRLLNASRSYSTSVLQRHGCRCTDHFLGFQITGRFKTEQLIEILPELPAGLTELMTHPGFCGPELRAAPTRLRESREWEREALTAPSTRFAVLSSGIQLVRYREL